MPTSKITVSAAGLGYAGLPVAFGRRKRVIGFDINPAALKNSKLKPANANEYTKLTPKDLLKLMDNKPVLTDVKRLFCQDELKKSGMSVWRL